MSISELKEMDIPSLKYMCMMVWHKPNGPNSFGCPTYNMEPILVAKRGRPQFLDTKDFRTTNLWEAPRSKSFAPADSGDYASDISQGLLL